VEEAARASEFRVRLELSERAESTLREELAEERRRREEVERESEDLRQELAAVRESRESLEMDAEELERAENSTAVEVQEGAVRPWWRRMFGS
jgi:chromosome segregation ATPase